MADKKSLEENLEEWLEKQGYPLEMEVAEAFQDAKFTVSLADVYEDFETHEPREIDVTALRWSDENQLAMLQVCYRIECKQTRDKPWIIFISRAQPDPGFLPFNLVCSTVYRSFFFDSFQDDNFRKSLLDTPLFKILPVGHGITQAFTTGPDAAYAAVMSAAKASIARALQIDKFFNTRLTEREHYTCCIVFPVVVLDGRLFVSYIQTDGKACIKELPSGTLYWNRTNPASASPFLHVVTKPYLEKFIEHADMAANTIIEATVARMDHLMEIARNASVRPSQVG